MKNFKSDNKIGQEGQNTLEDFFSSLKDRGVITGFCNTEHFVFLHLGLDYECDYVLWKKAPNRWSPPQTWGAECKSVAGSGKDKRTGELIVYDTTVIEAWQDDAKTKRPGWYKAAKEGKLDYIYIENRYQGRIYCYDAKELLDFVDNTLQDWNLTRCWQSGDDRGWIFRFGWMSKQHGFKSYFHKVNGRWAKSTV